MTRQPNALDRRSFVRIASAATVAAPLAGSIARFAHGAPAARQPAESAVGELYASLSDAQRGEICFDFNHSKRTEISANWHVTKHKIGDTFYSDKQRDLIDRVIRGVTTEDGYERFQRQMTSDHQGVHNYAIAIFGDPSTDQFQWELTGRHLTLRADGNSVPGAAFGGPLVYGHGVGNPKRSLFGYQTAVANEVFKSLDAEQSKSALVEGFPGEWEVELQGSEGTFEGVAVADLSGEQKQLVEQTLRTIIAPYRETDVEEAMSILNANGGVDQLRMAFYQDEDLLNDKVWDLWRIEGPNLVCHFRGAPHVHAYINIGVKQA
ncbi:DUF3500 domain-containing protein [Rosistilla carotiformis]|nr:DUF3500 domain-containing protein [Rosistilla carotiformis]